MKRRTVIILGAIVVLVACTALALYTLRHPRIGEPTPESVLAGRWIALKLANDERIVKARAGRSGRPDMNMKEAYGAYCGSVYAGVRGLDLARFHDLIHYLCDKGEEERSEFDYILLWGIVLRLLFDDGGDREGLVVVLSRTTVKQISSQPIEELLAVHGTADVDGLKRPVLVLLESYRKSTKDVVKANIVRILKNSFPLVPSEDVDDDEFVEKCATWYKARRKHLKWNPEYQWEYDRYPEGYDAPWKREPGAPGLFVEAE